MQVQNNNHGSHVDTDEEAISICSDNVLVWNALLFCTRHLSKPLIPFELLQSIHLFEI